MKKLLLLLLVVVGSVGTVSAKKIYFIDNWGRTNLQYYAWTGDSNNGWVSLTATSYIGKSDGWYSCYEIDLGDYTNFLIKHDSYDSREQTPDLNSADFSDGEYYEYYYDGSTSSEKLQKVTLYTYDFTVTTAAAWDDFYIYIWNTSNNNSISGKQWPGLKLTGTDNVYKFTFKSYVNTVGVLFNQGDQQQPKTADLTPAEGDNKYYISTVSNTGGQAIKTNASGYATAVSAGNLSMTSGIAYVAQDNGNGSAKAQSITGINYNNPFLIRGEANTTYCFAYGSGAELPFTNAFKAGTGAAVATTDGSNYNYILNGDAFYQAAGKTVAKGKAYLQLSKAATARALVFDDGDVSAVKGVESIGDANGSYYNLSGQRIANPRKGLYIQGGKKMTVK